MIVTNIKESTTGVQEIAKLIEQILAGAEHTAGSSRELETGTAEIAKNVNELNHVISTTAKDTSIVNNEAQELETLGKLLRDLVDRFTLT